MQCDQLCTGTPDGSWEVINMCPCFGHLEGLPLKITVGNSADQSVDIMLIQSHDETVYRFVKIFRTVLAQSAQ